MATTVVDPAFSSPSIDVEDSGVAAVGAALEDTGTAAAEAAAVRAPVAVEEALEAAVELEYSAGSSGYRSDGRHCSSAILLA